jgi:hypothetical protein
MQNNPTNRQKWIFEILTLEPANYVGTWAKYGVMWAKGKTTFDKDWLKANERHKEHTQMLNDKANEVMVDELVDAQKTALKQRERRLSILNEKFEELAKMQPQKLKYRDAAGVEREVSITKGDYLKGIEVMTRLDERISKADGTDAPTRTAQTDAAGKDVKQTIIKTADGTIINI